MKEDLKLEVKGSLSIWHLDGTGKQLAHTCNNKVQNIGCGTIARCLAGVGGYINTMYLLFSNGTVPSTSTKIGAGTMTMTDIKTTNGTINYYRVPIIHVATAGTEGYGDNIVTFQGMSGTGTLGSGASFQTGSKLYTVALVCSPTGNASDDILLSAAAINPTVNKVANAQLGVSWQISVLL